MHFVKGITGEMLPTESVYAAFVAPLEEFTAKFNDRKYINTSLVGAQLNGFENMSLEKALNDSEIVDVQDLDINFSYDKDVIFSNLSSKV